MRSIEQLFVLVEEKFALVADGHNAQHRAGLLAEHLPGHDVRVMFHRGDNDLIAGVQVGAAPTLRDEVDALGGTANEDDFARLGRAEEAAYLLTCLLVSAGGTLTQQMDGTMNVGVVVAVVVLQGVEYRLRLLRGGRVVEIDEWLTVNLLAEDRKILADVHHVEASGWGDGARRSDRGRVNAHASSSTAAAGR